MNIYALIPARGGSKSIQKKNLLPYNGKALFTWSVEIASLCSSINKIFVSTDDEKIISVVPQKAIVIKRPANASKDSSRDIEYLNHFLKFLKDKSIKKPDLICLLRPTSPNRKSEIIENAISFFKQNPSYDSLRGIRLAQQTPFKMWFLDSSNTLIPAIKESRVKEHYNAPRQELPPVYWQDGYVEIIRVASLENDNYPGKILGYKHNHASKDIDYISDIPNDLINDNLLSEHQPIDNDFYSS